jgi:hypothetical protein
MEQQKQKILRHRDNLDFLQNTFIPYLESIVQISDRKQQNFGSTILEMNKYINNLKIGLACADCNLSESYEIIQRTELRPISNYSVESLLNPNNKHLDELYE